MARDSVAQLNERYAPRIEVVARYEQEADYVLDRLKGLPAAQAQHVAAELGISPEKAHELLADFIRLCLRDLGDLRRRLVEVVDRV